MSEDFTAVLEASILLILIFIGISLMIFFLFPEGLGHFLSSSIHLFLKGWKDGMQ